MQYKFVIMTTPNPDTIGNMIRGKIGRFGRGEN